MYLDDGVSSDSAPVSCFARTSQSDFKGRTVLVADKEARCCYRQVRITDVGFRVHDHIMFASLTLTRIRTSPEKVV